jgi:hypothetical protein
VELHHKSFSLWLYTTVLLLYKVCFNVVSSPRCATFLTCTPATDCITRWMVQPQQLPTLTFFVFVHYSIFARTNLRIKFKKTTSFGMPDSRPIMLIWLKKYCWSQSSTNKNAMKKIIKKIIYRPTKSFRCFYIIICFFHKHTHSIVNFFLIIII